MYKLHCVTYKYATVLLNNVHCYDLLIIIISYTPTKRTHKYYLFLYTSVSDIGIISIVWCTLRKMFDSIEDNIYDYITYT